MSAEPELNLFGRLPAGSQPVSTSEDAADRLSGSYLHTLRRSVLTYIVAQGARGSTADEAVEAFGAMHNRIAPRFTELWRTYGYITPATDSDGDTTKRPTRSQRPALVFVATMNGRAALNR